MPLADYAHWNEDAEYMWWHEEGKHVEEPDHGDPHDEAREYEAADAFAEECYEMSPDELRTMLADKDYCAKWPKAVRVIHEVLADRGERADA